MSTYSIVQNGRSETSPYCILTGRIHRGIPFLQGRRADVLKERTSLWPLLLGPFFGMLYMVFLPLLFLLFVFMVVPGIVLAKTQDIALKGESALCMGCHAVEGMTKKFKNSEEISLHVDAKKIQEGVHSFLSCTDCHQDISKESHPAGREFKSREDFVASTSRMCRTCHSYDALKTKRMHYQAITQAKAPPCVDCHGAHSVKRVAALKKTINDNTYCLTCHQRSLTISSIGTTTSIKEIHLKNSVHKNLKCPDCHTGFTKESHTLTTFANTRDHSIALSGTCKRCHQDKLVQVEGSIHASMLRKNNLNAPVCTDCHGFHDIPSKAAYATMSGVPCKKCHDEVFRSYAESVHGKAKMNGRQEAPLCSSCHFAHEVKPVALNDKMKSTCFGCHRNAETLHQKWLPNTTLHLDTVSCSVCHSPDADHGITLRLVNKDTGQPITEEQIIALLGENYRNLIRSMSQGEGIDPKGLANIVSVLNEKGARTKATFIGSMSSKGAGAHKLALKQKAVKECEQCHNANSEFFKNVAVAIVRADGTEMLFDARQEVLGSLFSTLPAGQFYVLGGTRLRLLDYVGILMVAGGVTFPIAHLALRALTAPIRRNRKEKHS